MQKRKRFIQSIIRTSAAESTALPWQRGARRAAFTAKRTAPTLQKRSA